MQPLHSPIQWLFALLAVAAIGDAGYALFYGLVEPQRAILDGVLLCGSVCVVLLDQIRARLGASEASESPRERLPDRGQQDTLVTKKDADASPPPPDLPKAAKGNQPSQLADDFLKQ